MPAQSSLLSLSAPLSKRVEKLAKEAGRTPQDMLKFVVRDGIEYCEYAVKAVNEGLADFDSGRTLSLKQVRASLIKHRTSRRAKQAA
jgi:predicted transcriptional regulator